MELEWQASTDAILTKSALGHGEALWQAFAKVVRTPEGIMLYPNDQIFHWLPRHGFASDAEFEIFCELAKGKVEKFYDVA